jgi:sn-glycerol 3-phosphate transport system substrate-binding protein
MNRESKLILPRGLNRRGFLGLAAAGVAAPALASCAGGPSTSGGTKKTAEVDYSGVKPASQITFWSVHPGDSQEVTQQIIDAFHQSQSDIKVKLVTAGETYEDIAQKFQTAQTGGTLPDMLVLSDVWWFRYYMNNQIVPMDPLFEALDYDTGDYVDQLLADYHYADKTWAVPWARSTPLFYYNKDHWKQAGLPDRAPKTWDEFAEWAPRLQSKVAGIDHAFQMPALEAYAGWTFQNLLWGYGGGWSAPDSFDITCDSDASVQAIQFAADAVLKDKWAGVASQSQADDLSAGAVSATVDSTGTLVGIVSAAKFDVGAGFLPGGPETTSPVCPTGGSGLGIPSDVPKENQLAAATFIKFLTDPENCLKFSEATGYVPIRKSADTSSLTSKQPLSQVAIDQLDVTRAQDYARVFLPGGDLEMANSCADVLTQSKDVGSEMGSLKSTLEKIYQTQVKPKLDA